MTIVGRGHGSVGEWWFKGDEPTEPSGGAALRELLRVVEQVGQILESAKLLRPRRITASGWLTGRLADGTLHRVDRPDVSLDLPGTADGLAERAAAAILEQAGPALYPIALAVGGSGILLGPDGEPHEEEDVAWITARTLDRHGVTVGVQSDAFLPYSVRGDDQVAVWERNAPRLEAALGMVEQILGSEPWSETTPHARIEGFRLLNRTDVDGDVVPTLEEPS